MKFAGSDRFTDPDPEALHSPARESTVVGSENGDESGGFMVSGMGVRLKCAGNKAPFS